jgi:LmbE family N-acetylglucosaminyl deacetylase
VHPLAFAKVEGPLRILCLGAHCDDIDIGCGATQLRILSEHKRVEVTWVVLCSTALRARELKASARRFLRGAARSEVVTGGLQDGFLPADWRRAKELIEGLKQRAEPQVVFTHFGRDAHQDHRVVSELTWNTFRNHTILEYEIPKYDGDLGAPNFYVPVSRAHVRRKVTSLMSAYPSQSGKDWFTEDTFMGLARVRGIECHAASGFAEAFYARKVVL